MPAQGVLQLVFIGIFVAYRPDHPDNEPLVIYKYYIELSSKF